MHIHIHQSIPSLGGAVFGKIRSAIVAFCAMMLMFVSLAPSAQAAEVAPVAPIVNQSTTCGVRDTLTVPSNTSGVTYSVSGENVVATKLSSNAWPTQLPQGWERTSNVNRIEFRFGVLNMTPCAVPNPSYAALGTTRVTIPACNKKPILIRPGSTIVTTYAIVWDERLENVEGNLVASVIHPNFVLPALLPQGWHRVNDTKAEYRFSLAPRRC